jgi:hypothetical protein
MSKAPLSLEVFQKMPDYARLSKKQRVLITAFIEHGYDQREAYKATHPACATDQSVLACANKAFSHPNMRAALDVYFQVDALDAVKSVVLRAISNKKLTSAQAAMVKLYAKMNGVDFDAPVPEPEGKVVADRVVERDGRKLRQVVTDVGPAEEKS